MTTTGSKPIIVLAGNYREFRDYAKGDKRCIFGDREDKLRGLDAEKVVEVGTFWQRKDSHELFQIARLQVRGKTP
jgi:hypothetical protein